MILSTLFIYKNTATNWYIIVIGKEKIFSTGAAMYPVNHCKFKLIKCSSPFILQPIWLIGCEFAKEAIACILSWTNVYLYVFSLRFLMSNSNKACRESVIMLFVQRPCLCPVGPQIPWMHPQVVFTTDVRMRCLKSMPVVACRTNVHWRSFRSSQF